MAKNKKLNKKRISPSWVALIGSLIITLGGFFILYNFIGDKRLQAYDYMNEKIYDNETAIYDVNTQEINDTNEADKSRAILLKILPLNQPTLGYVDFEQAYDNPLDQN